jgi:hypothetical protein
MADSLIDRHKLLIAALNKGDITAITDLIQAYQPGEDSALLKAHHDTIKAMLLKNDCSEFRWTATDGQAKNLIKLKNLALEICEPEEGKELLRQMMRAVQCEAFSICGNITEDRERKTKEALVAMVLEVFGQEEGKALIKEMMEAKNYQAFRFAGDVATLKVLQSTALELFGELEGKVLIKHMMLAGNCEAFIEASRKGDIESLKAQEHMALEVFGKEEATEIIGQMMLAQNCAAFVSARREIQGHLLASKYTPLELRPLAPALISGIDETLSGFPIPRREITGNLGEIWKYGAYLDASYKIGYLGEAFDGIDLKKIVGNQRLNGKPVLRETSRGKEMDWERLSEAMQDVTYKKIDEIKDTVTAVSSYVARYMLAYHYRQEGKTDQLAALTKEELEKELIPFKEEVAKYFLENKTLPQMAQMSDQWHKLLGTLLKSSDDQSTLRDFAMEGRWYQTAPQKEIKVTMPHFTGYSIVNLTDAEELDSEGIKQKNCVSLFVDHCKNGYQIFSIRKDGEPQTTMGFEVRHNALVLKQNLGFKNRDANEAEAAIEQWFLKEVREGRIKMNFTKIGLGTYEPTKSEFENDIGVMVKDLTSERLNANFHLLASINRGDTYMFGREHKSASLRQFIQNLTMVKTHLRSGPDEGQAAVAR